MKVVAINGSPRRNGNTAFLIQTVFNELHQEGIETELIQITDYKINGCMACGACVKVKNKPVQP